MSVRAVAVLLALSGFGAASGCVQDAEFRGPMPVRNEHPAQLTVLHMDIASAATLPPGDFELRAAAEYSSLFLSGQGNGNSFAMDGEYLQTRLSARLGLPSQLELDLELPYAHTGGGFLDDFIINWHDFWGFPDQGRSAAPRNQWFVRATDQGNTAFEVRAEDWRPMDVPVVLKWQCLPIRPDAIGLALRAGTELPLGDDKRGFGNGSFDTAIGAIAEWRSSVVAVVAHLQHTFAGTPPLARAVGLHFADVTSTGIAAELPLSHSVTALAQVEWETSTLRQLGFDRVASPQMLLWIGGRVLLQRGLFLEAAVGEDLLPYVSPDVTIWLSMALRPGGGP